MNLRQLFLQKISFDPQEKLSTNHLECLDLLFKRYLNDLKSNRSDLLHGLNTVYGNDAGKFIDNIDEFCSELIKSIEFFYSHYPSKSYKTLDFAITKVLKLSKLTYRLVPRGYTFYRIRVSEKHLNSQSDLFHIPFDMRHVISEQRYSLNGCPCLYLANSTYTAWQECGSLDPSQINIVRFESLAPLEFLDLRFDIYNQSNISQYNDDEILYYSLIFPLIIATNQSTGNENAAFNAEYIISKKLTELVKDRYHIDGIMYSSTKSVIPQAAITNFILPTKETNKLKGQCSLLKLIFKATDVIKWNEIKLKGLNATLLNKTNPINSEIPSIQLDSNNFIPYNDSQFGELEIYMENNMIANTIK